jgi:cell division protein ZapA
MAHVSVTIAGRSYRMACADGEEPHLEAMAAQVDARVVELRSAFGEIGDQRLTVMTAVTFADELSEARRRLAALEDEIATLRKAAADERARHDRRLGALSDALGGAAQRIERVAGDLSTPVG